MNDLAFPMDLFYLVGTSLHAIGTVEPNGGIRYLPFSAIYTPSGQIYVRPAGEALKGM